MWRYLRLRLGGVVWPREPLQVLFLLGGAKTDIVYDRDLFSSEAQQYVNISQYHDQAFNSGCTRSLKSS